MTTKKRQVIITTEYRGVYHGTLRSHNKSGRECVLDNANMAIYWGTTEGVDQLANTGPTEKSKIAAMAPDVWLCGLTSVVTCTDDANKKWAKYKK